MKRAEECELKDLQNNITYVAQLATNDDRWWDGLRYDLQSFRMRVAFLILEFLEYLMKSDAICI